MEPHIGCESIVWDGCGEVLLYIEGQVSEEIPDPFLSNLQSNIYIYMSADGILNLTQQHTIIYANVFNSSYPQQLGTTLY